jgi:hypothetical protein
MGRLHRSAAHASRKRVSRPGLTRVHRRAGSTLPAVSADLSGEITAIATAALALLAIVTAIFAFVTFAWSGSRVRVDTRFGMYLSRLIPGLNSDQPTFLTGELVSATAHQGYPGVMLFAVIQNTGRLSITVHECLWHASGHGKQQLGFGTIGNPLGTPLPHRLEPGAQCYAVVDLATAMAVVDAPLRDKTLGRRVWPVVQLGNGRKRKGSVVEIPAKPEVTAPPAGPASSS